MPPKWAFVCSIRSPTIAYKDIIVTPIGSYSRETSQNFTQRWNYRRQLALNVTEVHGAFRAIGRAFAKFSPKNSTEIIFPAGIEVHATIWSFGRFMEQTLTMDIKGSDTSYCHVSTIRQINGFLETYHGGTWKVFCMFRF